MKPSAKFLAFSPVFILLLMLALSACGGITPSDNENVATSFVGNRVFMLPTCTVVFILMKANGLCREN